MIISAEITYSDGSVVAFGGEPLDLSTIPTTSPNEQAAEAAPTDAETVTVPESDTSTDSTEPTA